MPYTNHELIIEYVKEFGYIVPAKKVGSFYRGQMLPSELTRRCRELRKRGVLKSCPWPENPKFEMFKLNKPEQAVLL